MNRRKAILSLFLIGGGTAASYSGYKWWQMHHTPDMVFLDENKDLIAELAETIIPKTDTPGAKEAMAHLTIITLIKEVSDRKTQNSFIDGLKDLKGYTESKYGKSFQSLTASEKLQVMTHFRDKGKNFSGFAGKVKNKFLGKSFFTILKEYTTIGYCTSKPGATQGLAYDYIPGKYISCIPMTPNQKAWATK